LEHALALAERLHPDLAVVQARVEGAEGRALQAGLFPNPELVARIEAAPLTGRFARQAEYVVGVTQAVPLGQRLPLARRAEILDRDRLQHTLAVQRLEIRRRVQSAFATALYRQRAVQMRAEDVRSAENGVTVATARLAAGDAIPAEVAQVEIELQRAQLELESAISRRDEALKTLLTAIGEASLQVEAVEGTLEHTLTVPALESLMARVQHSPFVAVVHAESAVQRTRLELAEAQRTPDVHLDLAYRRLGDIDNAIDLGLRVPLALFDRQQGRIQEARAELAAAEAQTRVVLNELTLDLRTAHSQLVRAIATATRLQQDILPRAERVLQSAETRYTTGDISLAELLPIRRDWLRARLDALDALHDVMHAWAVLSPYVQ
jgi:cobalt-zinc-cadmium efflux system outer membrane protein